MDRPIRVRAGARFETNNGHLFPSGAAAASGLPNAKVESETTRSLARTIRPMAYQISLIDISSVLPKKLPWEV
jgi:hypothetical protein